MFIDPAFPAVDQPAVVCDSNSSSSTRNLLDIVTHEDQDMEGVPNQAVGEGLIFLDLFTAVCVVPQLSAYFFDITLVQSELELFYRKFMTNDRLAINKIIVLMCFRCL